VDTIANTRRRHAGWLQQQREACQEERRRELRALGAELKPGTPPIHGFTVVARRESPNRPGVDVVLVDRGPDSHDRWVTGIVARDDQAPTEWWWGHYTGTWEVAVSDFARR
jgi:hypothetical protein